jgi:hypothetical protein
MINLFSYLQDGANYQARAVLAVLQGLGDIEESWNESSKKYDASFRVARWENCREQGYVVSLIGSIYSSNCLNSKQLNIAFFEHRNSDDIHAVVWEQTTLNSPSINTAKFGEIYKDKYNTSFHFQWGEYMKMAKKIKKEFTNFYLKNRTMQNGEIIVAKEKLKEIYSEDNKIKNKPARRNKPELSPNTEI